MNYVYFNDLFQRRETVEAIEDEHFSTMTCHDVDVFTSMQKLRLLILRRKFTSSEPTYFPEQLRWLSWYLYPFQSLLINGGMTKLVGLEMQSGQMKQLQIERKVPFLCEYELLLSASLTLSLEQQHHFISVRLFSQTSSTWIYLSHII